MTMSRASPSSTSKQPPSHPRVRRTPCYGSSSESGASTGRRLPTLLHGDYGSHNLRMSAGEVRVFDFDECGVGPAEYDVANSLYLALFDLTVERGAGELFSAFRRDFLSSYDTVAATPLDRSAVDDLVILRAMMLSRWLAEPSIAPRGVAVVDVVWKTCFAEFITNFLTKPNTPA